ncbi:MAG TPA: hypothetical protein VE732_02665 [Nitrososphaera sp.]|jgi:hypothetical protein|nr:hypothetical protein [Nitrososphaera sp.]
MKQLLSAVLLALLTLPVLGQGKLREVNLQVGGIGSGTPYSTVLRKLGKPLRRKVTKTPAPLSCSGLAETHLTLFYSGLQISLLGDGRGRHLKVYSIEATSPKRTVSGLRLGASMEEVNNTFGEPNSKAEESGGTVFYYVTKGNLGGANFYFRNNKLVKVAMTETLC